MTSRRKKQPASTPSSSEPAVDFRSPDYGAILEARRIRLNRLITDSKLLAATKVYYRTHPWDFVSDWGWTFDPRNLEEGRMAAAPFVLWPRQVEYIQWVYESWQLKERGVVEKSRDCGVTWLSIGFAVSMVLFLDGFTVRFGSRKEDLIDKRGDLDSIFERLWFFIDMLPRCFLPVGFGAQIRTHMRIVNPENNSAVTGEAGDNIGRGGRSSICFVDEAAFIDHQKNVDAALSQTTNCQIDISTPNGSGNEFYKKRMRYDKSRRVFIFDWRQDPRKDQAWYDKKVEELDPVIVAQEIDRDYDASDGDSMLPAKWARACIDAHKRLGIAPQGIRVTAFDPADTGSDAKATANRHGVVITGARQWKTGTIAEAIPMAVEIADEHRADVLIFDGDGMGAPSVRTALASSEGLRTRLQKSRVEVMAFHGSGAVREPGKSRKAKHHDRDKSPVDAYKNFRAQAYAAVRKRMLLTYTAVTRAQQGMLVNVDPAELLSIDGGIPDLLQLLSELSRPQRKPTSDGKIRVESKDEMRARGVESPNMGDCVVMALSVQAPALEQRALVVGQDFHPYDPGMGY